MCCVQKISSRREKTKASEKTNIPKGEPDMFPKEKFAEISEKYMDTIFRIAFHYVKNQSEADDITQEVLLKLYNTQKCFENEEHIRNWLIRVTINCCKKVFLSPWRTHEPLETYKDRLSFSTPEHGDLFYMIMDLPRKYRVAIYLYYYEEYSTEEIAQLLHIPKATVATHLYRGRELLRKKINGGE